MLDLIQNDWVGLVKGVAILSFFIAFCHTLSMSLTVDDPSYKVELIDRVKAYLPIFSLMFVLYFVVIIFVLLGAVQYA